MADDNIRKLIKDTLVEPAGAIDSELILACKGLLSIDDQSKCVSVEHVRGMSDKDRIVLFCLGRRLLSADVGGPVIAEVKPADLLGICTADNTNKSNVYIGRLMKDNPRPLRRGKRGTYEVFLPVMKEYLADLKRELQENAV